MQRELKVNDPIRIIGKNFPTSLGLVRKGTIGRVLGFLVHERPMRVQIEVYGPAVTLYLPEEFVEYHEPSQNPRQEV